MERLKDESDLSIAESGTTVLVQCRELDAVQPDLSGSWLVQAG